MKGIVLKSTGSWFEVMTEDKTVISSRVRGQLRLRDIASTNPVAVGDHVTLLLQEDGTGTIIEIEPRKNYIIRKSIKLSKQTQILATNIDLAVLVVTPIVPKTSTGFIDRFIAAAESFHIPVALVFNKMDLLADSPDYVKENYLDIYEPLAYPCFCISTLKNENIEPLKAFIKDKISLFAGHSGVGKSSLINLLCPTLNLKVGSISKTHLKGKHTTTFAEMHAYDENSFLIDTPGIREFVNIDFNQSEISHYFKEMLPLINDCQFNNCLHENEKNCAVKDAVESGKIHPMRYYNYLSILHNEDFFK